GVGAGGVGTGGVGDTGGSDACAWTAGTSNATCAAGSCPIELDEQVECSAEGLGAWGLHVAATADATWLATSATTIPVVYRLTATAQELQNALTQSLTSPGIDIAPAADGTM